MEKVTLKIHNYFDAKLENVETGEVRTFKAYNQVQDSWFECIRDSGSSQIATYISVGDGAGTMSLSRTTLFHRLSGKSVTEESSEVLSHNRFKRVVSVLFTELEAVGNLTEVGLCSGGSYIVTHALFTDSEGNPITIPKTNTDRLTITATVFAEYALSGPLQRFGVYSDEWRPSTKLDYDNEVGNAIGTQSSYYDFAAMLVGMSRGIRYGSGTYRGYNFGFSLTHYPSWGPSNAARLTEAFSGKASIATVTNNLVRTEMSAQISSSDANLTDTYQIKCITMSGLFYLPFPNHDIYPPKQLTFELAGDGSTSGFNLGVPELMTSNVAVTVDGVAVSTSDFTFYGRDVTKWQGYPSADNRYLIATSIQPGTAVYYNVTTPFVPKRPSMYTSGMPSAEYIYDFETPITVDTLIAPRTAELLYSSDGTTWTTAATLTKTSGSASETVSFSPISARYWKLVADKHTVTAAANDCLTSGYNLGFFLNKPQLEFNNPPAAGALIEVTAYTEYPIKNDKWIIDQTIFDVTVERGDSE